MNDKLRLAALLGAVVMVASVATVVATHVEPEKKDGNPTCGDFAPAGVEWIEFKIEDESDKGEPNTIVDGNYSDGNITVTLEVTQGASMFNWTSDHPVSAVVVKGGPNANFYNYTPPALMDDGLHAPINPKNDKAFELSHISFCYMDVEPSEEPPEEPPEECPAIDLSAKANDDGSITVDILTNASFELRRSEGEAAAEVIGSFDGDTQYVDTNTTVGVTYTYFVHVDDELCEQVEVTAIPVFPTSLATVAAVGLSGLGYAVMRRRR